MTSKSGGIAACRGRRPTAKSAPNECATISKRASTFGVRFDVTITGVMHGCDAVQNCAFLRKMRLFKRISKHIIKGNMEAIKYDCPRLNQFACFRSVLLVGLCRAVRGDDRSMSCEIGWPPYYLCDALKWLRRRWRKVASSEKSVSFLLMRKTVLKKIASRASIKRHHVTLFVLLSVKS